MTDLESEARAAAEKRYPTLTYKRADYAEAYIAGAQRPTAETFDEDTLRKVYDALEIVCYPAVPVNDVVRALQNAGILFRERVSVREVQETETRTETLDEAIRARIAQDDVPINVAADIDQILDNPHEPADRRHPQPTEGEPAEDRDALARYQEALNRGLSEREAQEDGWPEGEPSDARIVDVLTAYYGEERDGWSMRKVERMRAALRAAGVVADQEGENRG